MSSASSLLLAREFKDLKENPRSNYFQVYSLQKDNVHCWEIYVIGPPDTPYAGGVYKALMRFPEDYPMKPPSVQFLCDIYHPNIYRDGKVCISTLQVGPDGKDTGQYWRPVLGIEQAVLSVISLLSDPNSDDPANTQAAHEYKHNRKSFIKKCQENAKKSHQHVPKDFVYPKVKPPKKEDTKKVGLAPPVDDDEVDKKKGDQEEKMDYNSDGEEDDDEFQYDEEDLLDDDDDEGNGDAIDGNDNDNDEDGESEDGEDRSRNRRGGGGSGPGSRVHFHRNDRFADDWDYEVEYDEDTDNFERQLELSRRRGRKNPPPPRRRRSKRFSASLANLASKLFKSNH